MKRCSDTALLAQPPMRASICTSRIHCEGSVKSKQFLLKAVLLVFFALCTAKNFCAAQINKCQRIVSFAPSVTELAFQLGLGKNVVGVTRYCEYPAAALKIAKVGGLLDPNIEAVVRLKPTLVVLLEEQRDLANSLNKLGLNTELLEHRSVKGILESFSVLGKVCGIEDLAKDQRAAIEAGIEEIKVKAAKRRKVRTMVVVAGGDQQGSLYVSGHDGFYESLLGIAGGELVTSGATISVPSMSAEGVLKLNPELILVVDGNEAVQDLSLLTASWNDLPIAAAQKKHVYILNKSYSVVPGPRMLNLLQDFDRYLQIVVSS